MSDEYPTISIIVPEPSPERAQAAGCVFYKLPGELTVNDVDALMWPIVSEINVSGWCWTAESCQGHPDERDHAPWANNTAPMLRLVCAWGDVGRLFAHLCEAAASHKNQDGMVRPWPVRFFVEERHGEGTASYAEALIYLDAATTYDRDEALCVWRRFATFVSADS